MAVASRPEVYLVTLAFFLNFAWEMWQIPFFEGMADAPHLEGVKRCTLATAGDVVLAVAAFTASSVAAGTRQWFMAPRRREVLIFLGAGLLVTISLEGLATGSLQRWEYSALMPVLPWLSIGLIPLLQWLVLPPIELAALKKLAQGDRVRLG